ncbi:MAG: phosphoribosylformylglycinamidine synthase [Desulfovibrionaceae bacterium]|nr:phosphoribosylformylglycinamidine synthase [Desulfovibrionaceae bacterium]
MLFRVEVGLRPQVRDVLGQGVCRKINDELGIAVDSVRIVKVYVVEGLDAARADEVLAAEALHDPVLHLASLSPLARGFDWALEVGFRPGVTDNEGRTAKEALAMALGLSGQEAAGLAVYTADQYLLSGDLSEAQVASVARDLLANELIQRFEYRSRGEFAARPFPARAARVTGLASDQVDSVAIREMSDEDLMAFSRANTLALSLVELHCIRAYYADQASARVRREAGLGPDPTDAELEVLAQTWSEHCKHKIFNARISYVNEETGRSEVIDSLFRTYIQASTEDIRRALGRDDFCLSVFKDNAGVIRFSEELSVCVKVETHNSPSALDPYGGALTGIVGVNRDPMGTGLGANMLCNTDVFCFASPFYKGELPPRLLHPRRVFEGVREGVEHGGNKSGVPTVNGSVVFDRRYLGKPLVFCGTVGLMPALAAGRPSHEKRACPGDAIVMCGGRIGKDGIHGATFSSEELHEGSPATAVQIGDPITQRKMYDFLMRARDLGLYNAITDNGAGGLSSSVGEMAQDCGGFDLDLARAPLKYDGLRPWEILISEAQERMTLAVPRDRLKEFMALSREMDVESTDLGRFTDSGRYFVRYGERPVALLDMDFVHHGGPQMELQARWRRPEVPDQDIPEVADHGDLLRRMLARLNICSKEFLIRQYDHEVKGGSVVKPLVGVFRDGPADAAVIRPDLGSERGLVVSHGICPKYSDLDTYWMMANAIDEAVRNAVAVGGDPRRMAGVDNFCWCDPVRSEAVPDGRYKLAQLVRANQALAHFCRAYGLPCVSGKDSMKNDYVGGGVKISIPPTVLYSVIGVIPDVNRCLTSDLKAPGEAIYVLGVTGPDLGASELASELGFSSGSAPQVDALSARQRYETLFSAIRAGLVSACHDCSDGGLACALAEMAIGGRLGLRADLDLVPCWGGPGLAGLLYSESAGRLVVTVPQRLCAEFEALFRGQTAARIGEVAAGPVEFRSAGATILSQEPEVLARAYKSTLAW